MSSYTVHRGKVQEPWIDHINKNQAKKKKPDNQKITSFTFQLVDR